jgi:hypothetical protein
VKALTTEGVCIDLFMGPCVSVLRSKSSPCLPSDVPPKLTLTVTPQAHLIISWVPRNALQIVASCGLICQTQLLSALSSYQPCHVGMVFTIPPFFSNLKLATARVLRLYIYDNT